MKIMNARFLSAAVLSVASFACDGRESAPEVNATPDGNHSVGRIAPSPIQADTPSPTTITAVIDGKRVELVRARSVVTNLVEDLKYATADNFMKRKMYEDANCYLLRETADRLLAASADLSRRYPGLSLKVWDCYRPMTIQKEMWDQYTNTPYVANPKTARHPRGRAVDITIVDEAGNDVEMPTKYDDFTSKAHPNAPTTRAAAANRELLRSVMTGAGFTGVNSEWWHFDNLRKH